MAQRRSRCNKRVGGGCEGASRGEGGCDGSKAQELHSDFIVLKRGEPAGVIQRVQQGRGAGASVLTVGALAWWRGVQGKGGDKNTHEAS